MRLIICIKPIIYTYEKQLLENQFYNMFSIDIFCIEGLFNRFYSR